ncbi:NAD(P)/FAD-dependent oxidoreductase [Roseiconus lacunae]|uniref:NAD(P)/FAD-dependent oxidoreductase n=1 Tax=Roseiconus lacunae TaxID=2605694 RepID=UPI0011F2D6AE|nr:NAD(P)/FAD-dependent oxidoreductase [Roseiconus lacunae]
MDRREMMTAVAATAGTAFLPQISAARDRSKEGIQFDYEAIVVGGGPAGLSAALVLGRCCRKVLVCDAGEHRNRTSPSVHSFFSRDGISPSELLKIGRDQLKPYDVAFHQCRIVSARQLDKGFQVRADSGKSFTASKLILATGVKDDLPHINGLAELWGAGVYHCPYCHGWEVRGKPWAYMADQKLAVEWGIELKGWTDSLTYCSGGSSSLTNAERERLRQHGIGIREQAIERVTGEGGKIRGIDFSDGGVLDVDAFFIRAPMIPRSSLAKQLGCKLVFVPGVFSDTAETDPYGATSVAGVYVVGDASVGAPQVATAVTDGAMAAIMLNKSLFQEAPAHSSK